MLIKAQSDVSRDPHYTTLSQVNIGASDRVQITWGALRKGVRKGLLGVQNGSESTGENRDPLEQQLETPNPSRQMPGLGPCEFFLPLLDNANDSASILAHAFCGCSWMSLCRTAAHPANGQRPDLGGSTTTDTQWAHNWRAYVQCRSRGHDTQITHVYRKHRPPPNSRPPRLHWMAARPCKGRSMRLPVYSLHAAAGPPGRRYT